MQLSYSPEMGADEIFYQALALKNEGELAKAAKAFQQALRGKLGNSQFLALGEYAEVLQSLERYKELDAVASSLIELIERESRGSTPAAEAWTRKAIALHHVGRLEQASEAVERALSLDASSATAHYEKACILSVQGRAKEAVGSVKKALRLDRSLLKQMQKDADLAAVRALPELKSVFGKSGGGASQRKVSFPKIPTRLDQAFALLASSGIELPRPRGAAPKGAPAPLAAFYGRASRLPGTSTDAVGTAGQLAKLNRAFARELDAEEDLGEGLPRTAFSATAKLVAFGSPDSGGYYFLDPRHGDAVFALAHDEVELRAEAPTFAAFVALRGLEAWAEGEGLEDAHARAVEQQRALARKRVRAKKTRR